MKKDQIERYGGRYKLVRVGLSFWGVGGGGKGACGACTGRELRATPIDVLRSVGQNRYGAWLSRAEPSWLHVCGAGDGKFGGFRVVWHHAEEWRWGWALTA